MAPWRVQVRSDVVLNWYEYLDARQIAPRMLYVKRWAPEDWPLAFQGQIHLLSSQDFALIEHEMRRTIDRRSRRRERPPYRPRLPGSRRGSRPAIRWRAPWRMPPPDAAVVAPGVPAAGH